MLGTPPLEIGLQTNHPTAAVKNLLTSPWAVATMQAYHERFMLQLQQRTFDPVRKFYDKLEEKIEILDVLSHSGDEKVALQATKTWIEHTIGSAVKRSEVTHKGALDGMNRAELAFVREHKRLPSSEERLMLSAPTFDIESEADAA